MSKSLWKNKIWLIFLIIITILLPFSISMPAQTENRSVAIAIGFDKLEDQVEVSAKIVVPHYDTTYSQNSQVISVVGENGIDALAKLSIHIGKVIGLSHCSAIIVSRSFIDDNLASLLDQCFRSKRVNYNALLIFTDSQAKEVLKKGCEISQTFTQNIYDIVKYNQTSLSAKIIYLSDFLKTYYDNYGASLVPIINLSETDNEGLSTTENVSSSNQSNSNGGNGSQNSQNTQYLSNEGETAVVKNGKVIKKLEGEDVIGFGLLTNESDRGIITLNNITDERLENADIVFSIRDRTLSSMINYSQTDKPRIYYKIILDVKLEQIIDNNINIDLANDTKSFISKTVLQAFKDKCMNYCSNAVNISKENHFDALNIYQTFDRFSPNKWQKYIRSLANKDNYIDDVEFFLEIVIKNVD